MSQAKKLFWGTFKLSSGKILSQGLAFVILPILTRIYSPELFGSLALFIATTSILSVIASFNYDVGITAAQTDEEATGTLLGAWLLATSFSLILVVALFFASERLFEMLGMSPLYPYRLLIALGVWLSSIFSCLNYYQLRTQKFGFIAKVGVAQTLSQAGVNLIAGVMKFLKLGLIFGDLFKHFVASSVYAWSERRTIQKFLLQPNPHRKIKAILVKLIQFPTYGLASDLIITLGVSLPALFISKVWSPMELGYFLVAQKIYDVPLNLVGGPIGRVFLSESIRLNKDNPSQILEHFKRTGKKLFALSVLIVPLTVVAFYYLSGPLLSESWGASGKIAVSMLPMAMARFFTSPISQISAVIKKQNVEFYVSFARLILIVSLFSGFYIFKTDIYQSLFIYSMASFVMYMIFFTVYYQLVKQYHIDNRGRDQQHD